MMVKYYDWADGIYTGPSTGPISHCNRYLRAEMSVELLDYLRHLKPVTTHFYGRADVVETTTVTIVDADTSWKSFLTDDSRGPYSEAKTELALPSSIKSLLEGLPRQPCIACDNNTPCEQGVCVENVCVNYEP